VDVNQSLNWKQVTIAVIALWAFGQFFTPIQIFVLSHPLIGCLILFGLLGAWFLYRRSKQS
jgi:hypothetical protein